MFDGSLPFQLIQIKKNKYGSNESHLREFIFKFYRHNNKCCIKYVVSIKEYEHHLLTLDYYPKINLTPKIQSRDDIQDLRYRLLTKQNSFGYIGGTIMDIMIQTQKITGSNTWGFLAANLVYENHNDNNKRYRVYTKVLSRSFLKDYTIFGNRKNSVIFVLAQVRENEQTFIIKQYESIFAETN